MTETAVFEGFAILELMGHRRLAGYVTEVEIAGHGMLRLDIPEVADGDDTLPAATQFFSPASVYALTPATEEMVRAVRSRPSPVHEWELPRRELLPAAALAEDDRLGEFDQEPF